MAKSLLQTRKIKKPKATRSETYMVNLKYLGDEPMNIVTSTDKVKAFNWYHNMCERSDARQYLKDYFKSDKSFLKTIDKIKDSLMPYTAAWVCRIATNQNRDLTDSEWVYVNDSIKNALVTESAEEETPKPTKVERPNIQDRIREKISDTIGEIEAIIDVDSSFSLYDWLRRNEIPPMYATKIAEYYAPIWNEFVQAHSGKLDGYEKWTKAQLKERMNFYNQLVSDAERYSEVAKKTKAVRKPRPVTKDKLLKSFKYQKESSEYKIASISPEKIIEAQELWTFNTKNGTLTHFIALDRGGLSVKGAAIVKYDENASKSYKTGRQTAKIIDQAVKSNKTGFKKLVSTLKDNSLSNRINENIILLKVF